MRLQPAASWPFFRENGFNLRMTVEARGLNTDGGKCLPFDGIRFFVQSA